MVGDTDNEVSGTVAGTVVQAGTIHGGVHFPSDRAPVVPRQLPAAVSHFVGRHDEFAALARSLDRTATGTEAVVISAINGTAGIGKTALAVHWAHKAADRFPDGQLYVDLRGFDPTGEPAARRSGTHLLGRIRGQSVTLDVLDQDEATALLATYYQQALALFRELDYRYFEADILSHLGYAHHADDNHSAAGAVWRQALAILDQLAHPNADVIRAALAEVDPS